MGLQRGTIIGSRLAALTTVMHDVLRKWISFALLEVPIHAAASLCRPYIYLDLCSTGGASAHMRFCCICRLVSVLGRTRHLGLPLQPVRGSGAKQLGGDFELCTKPIRRDVSHPGQGGRGAGHGTMGWNGMGWDGIGSRFALCLSVNELILV